MMVRVVLGVWMALWAAMPAAAQGGKMTLEGELTEVVTDQDGRSFYRELDQNDNLCALIKVTVVGELPNELIMEVGSLGVHKRIYDPNGTGELWFYVPYQTKNIWLKCATLDPIGPLPVRLSEGAVYRLKVRSNATSKVVTNVELSANYLKVVLNAEGATISLGKSKECEMLSRIVNGNIFSVRLNYGTYHYRIEHPDYMTATGTVEVSGTMGDLNVELRPAWGTLEIESSPEGATVYVSGRRVGTTPCTVERVKAGEVEVRLQHDYCYPLTDKVEVASGGKTTRRNYQLRLQVGKVTVKCPDREAEIWIDNKLYGKGSWTGYISSLSSHIVEARRDGYASQSAEFSVEDESTATVEIAAPVAYYGTLDLAVEPMMAQVEVDGNAVGTAPVMLQLTATTHKVRLTAEGYHPDEFEVTIGHNSTTTLSRTLTSIEYSPEDLYRKARSIHYNNKEEKFKWYLKAAKLGHAEAQAELGICYRIGSGVEKNENEAAKWYLKAAEQGNPKAQVNLAHFYQYGIGGLEESESKSAEWVRKAAEQGYPEGQWKLGNHYRIGTGVEKNFEMAVYWYRKGAEHGDELCRQYLAECYQKGEGVQKNINEALKWYKAILYDKGYISSYTAKQLLSQHYSGAAQRGDAEAQFIMGCIQSQNDTENRIRWFLPAAKQGHIEAQYRLGQAYVKDRDYEEAKKWLLWAAEKGHTNAQYELGRHDVSLDLTAEQGAEWIYKAAIKGHVEAQLSLGHIYFFGSGVTKDVNEAVKWYRKAAEQGDELAKDELWELGESW